MKILDYDPRKPEEILRSIKRGLIIVVAFILVISFILFWKGRKDMAIALSLGALLAVIHGVVYHVLVKKGKLNPQKFRFYYFRIFPSIIALLITGVYMLLIGNLTFGLLLIIMTIIVVFSIIFYVKFSKEL